MSFVATQISAQQESAIVVEEGSFILRNITMTSEMYLSPRLKGDVVNNTNKDWIKAEFEVDLYDKAGNMIKGFLERSFSFILRDIKKGEAKSLGDGYGELFPGLKRDVSIAKFEIRFKLGEYPARYTFAMMSPKENAELVFEDDSIRIEFAISKRELGFVLRNKTANPVRIDWNEVAFVDDAGESHKVMHSGIRYVERDKPQAPTIVPPTAKVQDIVFPIDYVWYSPGQYGGWSELPFFPEGPMAGNYKGKSFSVFMPLEVNGAVKNYSFVFKITDIEM